MALDFFAGCVGGAAGVIVGHPLDTVKVRLQTQDPSNIKYRGTFHCLSTIVKQESVSGLYKGISSPLFGVAGVNAIIFGVYGALRPYITSAGNDSLWAHFAAGSVSGAAQSFVASPMELVKSRMQINQNSSAGIKKVGSVDILKSIYQNGGMKSVFKGWSITLAREVPAFGIYFSSYEAFTRGSEGLGSMMLAGGMAGVFSWIFSYPIDVVKTRIQCDTSGKYAGVLDCVRQTYATDRRSFFRGCCSCVIRAFPTNAVTFTVVAYVYKFAGVAQDDVQNCKHYVDQLLKETAFEVKVPQYYLYPNSLTSCSLAAQKYDRTHFKLYQFLQQKHATAINEVAESEEEEEGVGGEKKLLLHEQLSMHMHDGHDDHNRNGDNAVRHNYTHIPSPPISSSTLVESEKNAKPTTATTQINSRLSHENGLPVQSVPSATNITNSSDGDTHERKTGASELRQCSAVKCMHEDQDVGNIQALSPRDLQCSSKSLDISISQIKNEKTVSKAFPMPAPTLTRAAAQAWKKYSLNFCKCFEDHYCVCYF